MRNIIRSGFGMVLILQTLLWSASFVLAQSSEILDPDGANELVEDVLEENPEDENNEEIDESEPLVVMSLDAPFEMSRVNLFDASQTILPEEYESVTYQWSFGDSEFAEGIEVVHSYENAGRYEVSLVVRVDGEVYGEANQEIFVYSQSYVLITDRNEEKETIDSLVAFAEERGVYIHLISYYESTATSEFIAEEELINRLNESLSILEDTDRLVVWTGGTTGLTLLSRFSKGLSSDALFSGKSIVVISDQNFSTLRNIADGTYRIINPSRMILTRSEALWVLFDGEDLDEFLSELSSRGIDYEDITGERELTLINFMSYLVNYMVEKGVPSNSLLLVLMLPVIVTIVAFLKQVVGLTTMGVYTPAIITLSLVALGIQFGLLIFFMILLFGTLTRLFLRRYRLLYIPRIAIVFTIVSLTILGILALGAYFNVSKLVSISIFPMLIMSTMVEKFVNAQGQSGFVKAFAMIGSTLFVSVICYYVVEWSAFKILMFGHPEIIFLFLIVNIILGRWTGLRVLEVVRFREIFRYSEE